MHRSEPLAGRASIPHAYALGDVDTWGGGVGLTTAPATEARSELWSVESVNPWVLAPAVAVVWLLLAVAGRYGFHRDELYFIESMRHPAWGYVDNGALTPALGWLSRQVFGDSVAGLRVIPALQIGLLVLVVAAIARELGGDRRAQLLAAVVTATSSTFLAIGHLLTTPTFDVLVTALVLLGAIRVARTGEQRWWLAIGAVIGVGLHNKYTIVLVLASLAGAALVTGNWRRLLGRWTLAGAAVALVVWAPQLWWQIDNGWPQIEFARALADEIGGENRVMAVPFQLLIVGPPLTANVIAGLWSVWRRPTWRAVRFISLAYVITLVLVLVTGGRGYYTAGLFPVLIAAGSIATVDWIDRNHTVGRRRLVVALIAVNLVVGAVITLPILPVQDAGGPTSALNEDGLETIGWPDVVEQVATAVPASERDDLVIVASNYGTAGAIDRYGAALGLPPAHSPHNSYATFRQPTGTGPVLLVGRWDTDTWFEGCELVATIATAYGIDNDVDGTPIQRCEGPSESWSTLWPRLQRYG